MPKPDKTDINTTRPTSLYHPTHPRPQTLSIALPSSLLHNSKRKLDLRTSLAGNISRALAVFCVDEIVIYDDGDGAPSEYESPIASTSPPPPEKLTAFTHPSHYLRFLLSFQETPPFMRGRLFPVCEDLKGAGLLPSLDIPSHLRATEWCEFREGITVRTAREGTYVDCGLPSHKLVRGVEIPPSTRVTLRLRDQNSSEAEVVAPDTPRSEGGYYWGYTVRGASGLSTVFTEAPFDGGYDLSVGTSERGEEVATKVDGMKDVDYRHMIIVFGGVKGLEEAAANDEELQRMGIGKARVGELFDHWVNLLPGQGSRTIRTEEAVWMGLMALRGLVDNR